MKKVVKYLHRGIFNIKVNPLNTIRFRDFREFLLRQCETLTAHISETTITMDL
jgi:hypothetical protein